jgi:cell shape-determining protein MreC
MIHQVAALPQMPDLDDPTNYPARLRRLEEILHRKLVYINSLEEENKTYREQLGLEGPSPITRRLGATGLPLA